FEARVGERGLRLSGGQRQRIGIARALYRDARLLVMDEGTSSQDARTERELLETLHALKRDRTIILIAHREETLAGCDCVLRLDEGSVSIDNGACGSFFREGVASAYDLETRKPATLAQ